MKDLSKESTGTLSALLEALNTVHAYISVRGEYNDGYGLCSKVDAALKSQHRCKEVFRLISTSWPLYSGNPEFPVPVTDKVNPLIQYCYGDLYKGKQLELRLNLLEYCVQVIQQELRSRDEVIYEVR